MNEERNTDRLVQRLVGVCAQFHCNPDDIARHVKGGLTLHNINTEYVSDNKRGLREDAIVNVAMLFHRIEQEERTPIIE